jgi:hypothetical protein
MCSLSLSEQFTVEAYDANGNRIFDGGDDCEIMLITPSGKNIPSSVVDSGDGTYNIVYYPSEPGDYAISVYMNGASITESMDGSLSLSLSLSLCLVP